MLIQKERGKKKKNYFIRVKISQIINKFLDEINN